MINSKQIDRVIKNTILTSEFLTNDQGSIDVNSIIVPLVNSLTNKLSLGAIDFGIIEVCEVISSETESNFFTIDGHEIYGKLSKISNTWFLNYFCKNIITGAEEPCVVDENIYIKMIINIRDRFMNLSTEEVAKKTAMNRKKIYHIQNQSSVTIPYNKSFLGYLPIVQFWDESTSQMSTIQCTLDDLQLPTKIYIDFLDNVNGWVVIL